MCKDTDEARAYCRKVGYTPTYSAALVAAFAATNICARDLDDAAWERVRASKPGGGADMGLTPSAALVEIVKEKLA